MTNSFFGVHGVQHNNVKLRTKLVVGLSVLTIAIVSIGAFSAVVMVATSRT